MKNTFMRRLALVMTIVLCFSFAVVAISAAEDNYAPSIEAKPTPEIVAPGQDAGVGAIINAGSATEEVLKTDINAISYEEAKNVVNDANASGADKSVCQTLVNAYDSFKNNGVEANIEGVKDFAVNTLGVSNPQYFVSNLFELNIGDRAADLEGDSTITVLFSNVGVNAEAGKLIVAHIVDGEWKIVPKDHVKVTAETIEVTFDELCPVVFLSVSAGEADEEPIVTDPITGDDEPADEGFFDRYFAFFTASLGAIAGMAVGIIVIVLAVILVLALIAAIALTIAYFILKKKGNVDETFVGKIVNKILGIFNKEGK